MSKTETTLEVGGIELKATLEDVELVESPHTRQEVRRLVVETEVRGSTLNRRFVDALSAGRTILVYGETGQRTAFRLAKPDWYSEEDGNGDHHYRLELVQVEDIKPILVVLGEIEVDPYEYDEVSDRTIGIIINLKAKLDPAGHDSLLAMLAHARENVPHYFPVLRKGVQDATPMMRFGQCYWSENNGEFKHQLCLVEQTIDEAEPELTLIFHPSIYRAQETAAKAYALVSELVQVLEQRGILKVEEIKDLTTTAERRSHELLHEFYRLRDVDVGH